MALRNVEDIAAYRLCIGCGACAAVCPENNLELIDIEDDGIRPFKRVDDCKDCARCVEVCPGYRLEHCDPEAGTDKDLRGTWGPIREIWEGHASDDDLRFCGSSGGAASALAWFGLKSGRAQSVYHVGPDTHVPWKNATVRATTYKELLSRTGSRYAPASPCEALRNIRDHDEKVVFVGKPCDVAGVRRAQKLDPELSEKIVCVISIFCAGTPSTAGTLSLLDTIGEAPENLDEFRFRGRGWPGYVAVRKRGRKNLEEKVSYKDSWHLLQKFRPLRCHLCPDGTGEFADIACGDPWYREVTEGDPGRSLVIARTVRGSEYLAAAREQGLMTLERSGAYALTGSQSSLAGKRASLWGRLLALRLLGMPIPRFAGFHLFKGWLGSALQQKTRSIFGTLRRGLQRGYYKKRNLREERAGTGLFV